MALVSEVIHLTKNPDRQAELLFYTMAFAERCFDRNFLVKFLLENKKMIEHWEQVPVFGDLIKKRVREAESACFDPHCWMPEGITTNLFKPILSSTTLFFHSLPSPIVVPIDFVRKID